MPTENSNGNSVSQTTTGGVSTFSCPWAIGDHVQATITIGEGPTARKITGNYIVAGLEALQQALIVEMYNQEKQQFEYSIQQVNPMRVQYALMPMTITQVEAEIKPELRQDMKYVIVGTNDFAMFNKVTK